MTGAGSNQKRDPEGCSLRGHHWPERWVTDRAGQRRMPELFVVGEPLAAGGRAVLEVTLYEGTHALAVVRGIRDTRTWVLDGDAWGSMVRNPHDPMAWPTPVGGSCSRSSPPRTRAYGLGCLCAALAGGAPGRHQGVQGLVQGAGRR